MAGQDLGHLVVFPLFFLHVVLELEALGLLEHLEDGGRATLGPLGQLRHGQEQDLAKAAAAAQAQSGQAVSNLMGKKKTTKHNFFILVSKFAKGQQAQLQMDGKFWYGAIAK